VYGSAGIHQTNTVLTMKLYCPYCGEPKGDKWVCCEENHFVPFEDLYEDMQQEILNEGEDE
jgi:hypothetical protein